MIKKLYNIVGLSYGLAGIFYLLNYCVGGRIHNYYFENYYPSGLYTDISRTLSLYSHYSMLILFWMTVVFITLSVIAMIYDAIKKKRTALLHPITISVIFFINTYTISYFLLKEEFDFGDGLIVALVFFPINVGGGLNTLSNLTKNKKGRKISLSNILILLAALNYIQAFFVFCVFVSVSYKEFLGLLW